MRGVAFSPRLLVLFSSGVFWGTLGPSGCVWVAPGRSGVFWGTLEHSGVIWATLGYSGALWCIPLFGLAFPRDPPAAGDNQ